MSISALNVFILPSAQWGECYPCTSWQAFIHWQIFLGMVTELRQAVLLHVIQLWLHSQQTRAWAQRVTKHLCRKSHKQKNGDSQSWAGHPRAMLITLGLNSGLATSTLKHVEQWKSPWLQQGSGFTCVFSAQMYQWPVASDFQLCFYPACLNPGNSGKNFS